MEREYVDILKKIGESKILDKVSMQVLTGIDNGHHINYLPNWGAFQIESLTDIEIINIFRGLILAEQCYSDLCGSASVGKIIYREIDKRNLDLDLEIANWAYTKTRNGYIPFDSNGNIRAKSKDVYEFIRNSESLKFHNLSEYADNRIKNLQQYLDKKIIDEKNVTIQTLEKIIIDKESIIIDYKKKFLDLKTRLVLANASPTELAAIIIDDNEHTIYFYHKEIERLIDETSIDKKQLENILNKFKQKENKHNTILKDKLIDEIKNR